ncbi:hypothetical protein CEK62_04220 [Alcanivorax sp. N3-2A]|nr:hypothetical protein CEK62_04220 [Alcanivorax sp. N3-2A]
MSDKSFKVFLQGRPIFFTEKKYLTNEVWIAFYDISSVWKRNIAEGFYEKFSDLDDLYVKFDELASSVVSEAVDKALTVLSQNGVYDLGENDFVGQFMDRYITWNDDVGSIMNSYEDIIERTEDLDAYRTARRNNRRMWAGYTEKGVYDADGKNFVNNVGHGVFNLLAKGITALDNHSKKNEIFSDPTTKDLVVSGVCNLVDAACNATVDALGSLTERRIHKYSDGDKAKVSAIIENIEKGRVPEHDILNALIGAFEFYPYDRRIYFLFLKWFGDEGAELDGAAAIFGIHGLDDERRLLIALKCKEIDWGTPEGIDRAMDEARCYASYIHYVSEDLDFEILRAAGINSKEVLREDIHKKKEGEKLPKIEVGGMEAEAEADIDIEDFINGFSSLPGVNFYVAPDLPEKKLSNYIKKSCYDVKLSDIIFYFDETLFGKGDRGVVVAANYIVGNIPFDGEFQLLMADVFNSRVSGLMNKNITLSLKDGEELKFSLTQSNKGADLLNQAINRVLMVTRG